MATIESMQSLVASISDSNSTQIPGLNIDTVINGMIENNTQYRSQLDSAKTEKERAEMKAEIAKSFKANGATYINEQINIIKAHQGQIITGIDQLTQNISSTIAAALLPSAIPAAPNPVFVALDLKIKKNTFQKTLDDLLELFRKLLQAAINLSFVLPDSVLSLLEGLNTVKSLLDTIPV